MARHRMALIVFSILCTLMISCLGATADTSFQTEMMERMKSLEKQGKLQAEKILAMESTISDYKQRVADLEQTVAELQQQQDPDSDKDQVDSNVGSNQTPGIVRQERSENTARRSSTLSMRNRRALLNAEGPVAFHAVINGGDKTHLGLNQNILFPDVMANLGGGYHNQHGVFIAPQPGVYIFSTSIMARDTTSHTEIYVHLMKNGQALANAGAHADAGRYDQGSVTVVTQLVAGDEVWVSLYGPANTSLYGDLYDSFMGCLVIPL